MTAKIRAVLQGPERGILVFGTFFFLLFLSSSFIDAWSSGLLTKVGGYVGLSGLIALLVYWFFGGKGSEAPEMAMTTISATPDELLVSTPSSDPVQVFKVMREVIDNRQALPAPHGSVKGRTPEKTGALEAYSGKEREQVLEKLNKELESHDKQVMDQIRAVERLLPKSKDDESSIGVQRPIDKGNDNLGDPKDQKKD